MDNVLAGALEFTAAEVADAPLPGYRIEELVTGGAVGQERLPQPWIETANVPVSINVEKFRDHRQLDQLLGNGSLRRFSTAAIDPRWHPSGTSQTTSSSFTAV